MCGCAPIQTGPITGRIVNVATGAEGRVSILRGSLYNSAESDNVQVFIGKQVLTGRSVLIDTGIVTEENWVPRGGLFSAGDWRRRSSQVVSRSGNLIARGSGLTLSCRLLVSADEHGTGDCQGSDKNSYLMQF